jgi:RNA recognition motif-containing protein
MLERSVSDGAVRFSSDFRSVLLGAYRIAGNVKGESIVSKKLFVGSLSWNTTDEGLRRAFEKFGEVLEAKVIKDRETDRSRGFGFVSFANPKDAMDAMAAMDGQELDGRTIKVNEAQERERTGGGGGPRGGGFGGGRGGERRSGGGGGERRGGGGGRW